MRILSFDQASKTAWSLFIDGLLSQYGTEDFAKVKDYDFRIHEIKKYVKTLVALTSPDIIVFEGIQFQSNQATFMKLAQLQGVMINFCIENGLKYKVVSSASWRSYNKIKGRKRAEQKANCQAFVLSKFNISVDEDVADSIAMGFYVASTI